jgi:MFS family permease
MSAPHNAAALTAHERAFVLRVRLEKMLWEGAFGVGAAALNIKLMSLANQDTALLASAHAAHWSLTSIGKVLLSPVYGAASDSLGRKWLWALGRLAMVVQFAGWWGCGSLRSFVVAQTVAWGALPLDGSMKVADAAWADVFGERPDLSAKLQAQTQVFVSAAGLLGPILGAQITRRANYNWAFVFGMAMALAQSLLIATGVETLPPGRRKRFTVSKINPFKGLGLLFTNGPGLRRLAISGALFNSVSTIYATFDPYRLGPIGWSPAEQSYQNCPPMHTCVAGWLTA